MERELTPAGVDRVDGGERSAIKRKAAAPALVVGKPGSVQRDQQVIAVVAAEQEHTDQCPVVGRGTLRKSGTGQSADQPAAECHWGHRAQPQQASAAGSERIVCIAGKVLAHAAPYR